jgi:saccharopine dehydrogenase (NADP+, L-glutamate forming)
VKLILEGKIYSTGVRIPTTPEFYDPILNELEEYGISFVEEYADFRVPFKTSDGFYPDNS